MSLTAIQLSEAAGNACMMSDALEATDDDERAQGSGVVQSVPPPAPVIEPLASAAPPVRLTALASSLGEPKAKIHRHLSTLKFLGFVDQDAQTECYRLGPERAHIGHGAGDQLRL